MLEVKVRFYQNEFVILKLQTVPHSKALVKSHLGCKGMVVI